VNELTEADAAEPAPEESVALVPITDDLFPERLEMNDLASMAVTLAFADLVPKPLRGKPNDVFMVLLTARDLGVRVTTALREFHVIDGKLTLSPKVRLAMVNEQGAGKGWKVWKGESSTEAATSSSGGGGGNLVEHVEAQARHGRAEERQAPTLCPQHG